MITTAYIASQMSVDPIYLSARCNVNRGTFLGWITREILINEWHRLLVTDREYLVTVLENLLQPGSQAILGTMFDTGLMVYKYEHLNRLARLYQTGNPFGVKLS